MTEDSMTRFPKNHKIQNDKIRSFLAAKTAKTINPQMAHIDTIVVDGSTREKERGKS